MICLYPKDFRVCYRDDLVQHFADLAINRGTFAACARTSLDLIVTVPRYRLEKIVSLHRTTALNLTVGLLAAGGILSLVVGVYPGLVLLAVAVAFVIAQRSSLAQAIRTPDSRQRSRRLTAAATFAALCLGTVAVAMLDLWGEDSWGNKVIAYNAAFVLSLVGAVVSLIAGLLTPNALHDGQL